MLYNVNNTIVNHTYESSSNNNNSLGVEVQ